MNVAVLGYGTVGSGVVEILKNEANVQMLYVFNRFNPIKKAELGNLYTDNIDDVLNDSKVDVVIETMGGMDAYEIIKRALLSKKHVITANKEVVAIHLQELINLAKNSQVMFLFEASVGGGIPIVCNLSALALSDEIVHIMGILNGTTNYILTRVSEGVNLKEALKEAQSYGYAEADSTADLEGLDMVRKIMILAMLATNSEIAVDDVYHYGIQNITLDFVDLMAKSGKVVKFIAEAIITEEIINLVIEPIVIDRKHLLSNINYAFNGVLVESKNHGQLFYSGQGAGKFPTAGAIVDDLYKIIKNQNYLSYSCDNKYVNQLVDDINDYYVYDGNSVLLKKNISRNDAKKYQFYARII